MMNLNEKREFTSNFFGMFTVDEFLQTVDLYEGQDPNAVLVCLASLARKSEKLCGKPGLGPKV